MNGRALTDIHCHLAVLPTSSNGCLVSRRILKSTVARLIAWQQGLPLDEPELANRLYLERLSDELQRSEHVSRAVLLAMDGVYDDSGRLDERLTDLMIRNDVVLDEAARSGGRFLAGVSINPRRRDAIEELERCAQRGARLVKFLPNAQVFDPALDAFRPFYRRMAELGLPLLSHIGYESTLAGHDQSMGNPERLIPALEEGATVIAAHGCSSGRFLFERHLAAMTRMLLAYPRFFTDAAALTLPTRVGGLLKLRSIPEVRGRLVYGTDYPLPCFSLPAVAGLSWGGFRRACAARTRFDRQYRVLEALGLTPIDFESLRMARG